MNEQLKLPTREEILTVLRPHRTALVVVGLIQGLLGVAAIAAPQIATDVGTRLFGILLLLAGVIQIGQARRIRNWKGTGLLMFGGLLDFALAGALLVFPHRGAIALTLVLGLLLFAQGIVRMIFAFGSHLPVGRLWFFLGGLASAVLGALLWWEWPADSVWAIGLILGVNLVMGGLAVVGLAGSLGGGDAGPAAPA